MEKKLIKTFSRNNVTKHETADDITNREHSTDIKVSPLTIQYRLFNLAHKLLECAAKVIYVAFEVFLFDRFQQNTIFWYLKLIL